LSGLRLEMPIIEKPHFTWKVEQTKSAFAEGNARW
jgi:NCS1 family nucleobase:cation symporter-1